MFSKFKGLNILKTKPSSNKNFEIDHKRSGIQSAISWEHPWFSLFLIVIINIGFGLVKMYDWDIFSVLFIIAFVLTVYDNWLNVIQNSEACTEHCKPTSNSEEIKKFVTDVRLQFEWFIQGMHHFRVNRKLVFASIMITFCGIAVLINDALSGFWLIYLTLVTPLLFPLIYVRILPDTVKEFINHYTEAFRLVLSGLKDNYNGTDDDFMPEMSEETMNNLNEAYKLLLDGKNDAGAVIEEIELNDLSASSQALKTDFLESSSVSSSANSGFDFSRSFSRQQTKSGHDVTTGSAGTIDDVSSSLSLTAGGNKSTEKHASTGAGLLSTFSNMITSNTENFSLIGYNLMNTVIHQAKQRMPRRAIDVPVATVDTSPEIDSSDDEFEIIDEQDLHTDD